jgi:hypothetical protein
VYVGLQAPACRYASKLCLILQTNEAANSESDEADERVPHWRRGWARGNRGIAAGAAGLGEGGQVSAGMCKGPGHRPATLAAIRRLVDRPWARSTIRRNQDTLVVCDIEGTGQ